MRSGFGKRLVALSVAAVLFEGLVGTWGALAATTTRTVPLKLGVTGSGTVRVTGNHPFTCHAKSCSHTFHVVRGRRVVVRASPSKGWKLTKWHGACEGSAATCSVRLVSSRGGWVDVVFVPPGDYSNPVRLGAAATIGGGWRLKVKSVTRNADAEVEAVIDPWSGLPANLPPPAGDQYTLVNVAMTNVRSSSPRNLSSYLQAGYVDLDGNNNYRPSCIPPPLDLTSVTQVNSGQTVTGNLCFEIASNDAPSLTLSAGTKYFALR